MTANRPVLPAVQRGAPHPCEVLDRQTAESLLGGASRESGGGRGRQKLAEVTIAGCMYTSADRNIPRPSIVQLFEYEYLSSEAAKRVFNETRSRQVDPSHTWENKPGIGESAAIWKTEDRLGIVILKGNRILDLNVSRLDWRQTTSLPGLVTEVGARAARMLWP